MPKKYLKYIKEVEERREKGGDEAWLDTVEGQVFLRNAPKDVKTLLEMNEFMYGLLLVLNIDKEFSEANQALENMVPNDGV